MIMYNYANSKYDNNISLSRQKSDYVSCVTATMDRVDSMSFTFDPVPIQLLREYYPSTTLWGSDVTIYERKIGIDDLDLIDLRFEGVEVDHQDYRSEHLSGTNLRFLRDTCNPFHGTTEPAYHKLITRPDFKGDLDAYYAVYVPHLMVWDRRGMVKVSDCVEHIVT